MTPGQGVRGRAGASRKAPGGWFPLRSGPAARLGGLAALLSLCLATCAAGFYGDGPINVDTNGVAIKGYDPVAYFTEGRPVKGSPELAHSYRGAEFHFASEENRRRFADNPRKYVPAFGGFCSVGVANGYKDDMHPEAFAIVGGRLYFNLSPQLHRQWLEHREEYRLIERARRNWPELRFAPGHGPADGR